jgi:hypothetical protein
VYQSFVSHLCAADRHGGAGGMFTVELYANLWTPPAQGELLAPGVECTNLSGLLWDR